MDQKRQDWYGKGENLPNLRCRDGLLSGMIGRNLVNFPMTRRFLIRRDEMDPFSRDTCQIRNRDAIYGECIDKCRHILKIVQISIFVQFKVWFKN